MCVYYMKGMTQPKTQEKPKVTKAQKREIARRNLEKAREILVDKKRTSALTSTSRELVESTSREGVESTSKEVLFHLGTSIKELSRGTSGTLLKSAYGYKSLLDCYMNMVKMVYPQGINQDGASGLGSLLGNILPDLKRTLLVNVNIGLDPANARSMPQAPSPKDVHVAKDHTQYVDVDHVTLGPSTDA